MVSEGASFCQLEEEKIYGNPTFPTLSIPKSYKHGDMERAYKVF